MPTLANLAKASTPSLRDIYGYFGPNFLGGDPTMAGDNAGNGTSALGLHWQEQAGGTENGGNGAQLVFDAPEIFNGAVTYGGKSGSPNNGGGENRFEIDSSKLPQTRFGGVSGTAAVDSNTRLKFPNLRYDDPNYGTITPIWNVDTRDRLNDFVALAAPAAAMAGIGALGMPSMAGSFVNLARGLGSGHGVNLGAIVGMLGNMVGLPAPMTTLARLAAGRINGGRIG